MSKLIKTIINIISNMINEKNDPLLHCDVYRKHHCAHIDGYLCNIKTCDILSNYRKNKHV